MVPTIIHLKIHGKGFLNLKIFIFFLFEPVLSVHSLHTYPRNWILYFCTHRTFIYHPHTFLWINMYIKWTLIYIFYFYEHRVLDGKTSLSDQAAAAIIIKQLDCLPIQMFCQNMFKTLIKKPLNIKANTLLDSLLEGRGQPKSVSYL